MTNLVCEQLSVGLVAAMAGAILLLLIGTQILDWWWPLALFIGGAAISAWRTMRFLPSPYSVAQLVDLSEQFSLAAEFRAEATVRKVGTTAKTRKLTIQWGTGR